MPLPEATSRSELHHRRIDMRGYRREDGLFDIEGHVVDRRTYGVQRDGADAGTAAGSPVHDMWVRLVVDADLVVKDIVAVTDASPYSICREAVAPMAKIIGEQIKPGWSNMVKARLGGAQGCTHLMELLIPLATVAYQTIYPVRISRPDVLTASGRPAKIDSCYAFASHREVVARRWPAFHTLTK
jgi:Protein of unknown function (DUF2889)